MVGSKGVWINDIKVVNKNKFLIDGFYLGDVILGRDTLPMNDNNGQNFITHFEEGAMKLSMPFKGKVLGVDQNFFCVVGNDGALFRQQTVSKFDLKNHLMWKYSLSLIDSIHGFLTVTDVCFDDIDNTYLLFAISGDVHIKNEVIKGPADVVVKIGKNGDLLSFKKISKTNYKNTKLRMKDGKICAYGGSQFYYHSTVLDGNLKEEIQDDELNELCKFNIWNKVNYFRIEDAGWRPKRLFYFEKYNAKNKTVIRKEVFRDTVRFQGEIYQHDILDFNRNKILCVYVSRGSKANNIHNTRINILIIKKKNLDIANHITIDCDRLITGETGISNHVAFQVLGKDLLIGNEYVSNCRIGNISLGDKDNTTNWNSFFIVKQSLK